MLQRGLARVAHLCLCVMHRYHLRQRRRKNREPIHLIQYWFTAVQALVRSDDRAQVWHLPGDVPLPFSETSAPMGFSQALAYFLWFICC